MTAKAQLTRLITFVRSLTDSHDGDCRVYPEHSNNRPYDPEDCTCFNKDARHVLRAIGIGLSAEK